MGRMSPEAVDDLLREPNVSIVATLRRDGTAHMTPVWHLVEDGRIILAVERRSVKAKNVANDPRVTLCVATCEKPQWWAQVSGKARLTADAVADVVRRMSVHYMGAIEGNLYADQVLRDPDFVLVEITPAAKMGFDLEE